MCILCEIKKMSLALAGMEVKKVLVGKVDAGLILNLTLAESALEEIQEASIAEVASLKKIGSSIEEIKAHLTPKYADSYNAAARKRIDAWDAIYTAAGITDGDKGTYRINQRTCEVFKEEVVPKSAQGVH